MTVVVNSVGAGVEISWEPLAESGPIDPPEAPPGYPAHPIVLPPEDGDAHPEHPIYLPPYIDNSLPGGGGDGIWGPTDPRPSQPIELPDDILDGIADGEAKEKLIAFLEGNLPPYEGAPEYPAPTGGKQIAVQVFGQGQDGDWSNTAVQPNDGLALLRYPEGFSGESYIEVRGLDGSLVDSGTITVG